MWTGKKASPKERRESMANAMVSAARRAVVLGRGDVESKARSGSDQAVVLSCSVNGWTSSHVSVFLSRTDSDIRLSRSRVTTLFLHW